MKKGRRRRKIDKRVEGEDWGTKKKTSREEGKREREREREKDRQRKCKSDSKEKEGKKKIKDETE